MNNGALLPQSPYGADFEIRERTDKQTDTQTLRS